MADQPNVFGEAAPAANLETPPQNQVDKTVTLLASIKNEDGAQKYDSIEKAIEALAHSQAYIPQVKTQLSESEQEIARLKAELSQRESIDEVVKRLTAREPEVEADRPAANGMTEQTVEALVKRSLEQTLSQRDAQAVYNGNVSKVQETLIRQFGSPEKAQEVVAAKAAALGTTPAALAQQAGQNPALILELFKAQGSTPNPTTPGRNMSLTTPPREPLKRPEKSLLRSAHSTNKNLGDYMKEIQKEVYAKHGITE